MASKEAIKERERYRAYLRKHTIEQTAEFYGVDVYDVKLIVDKMRVPTGKICGRCGGGPCPEDNGKLSRWKGYDLCAECLRLPEHTPGKYDHATPAGMLY